ncbi:MAG: CHAD domain-containing protein [bacterium]
MADESLLREPAERGVRIVALAMVENAQKAAHAFVQKSEDGEGIDDALHDFRVAVRRFRSWLRAFKPVVNDSVSKKQRQRLSDIAEATSRARDAAVHLEWLRDERAAMSARQRVGQAWLSDKLQSQRTDGLDAALAAASEFARISEKQMRRLGVYRAVVNRKSRAVSFGAVVADRVLEELTSLRDALADVHGSSDADNAHHARIAAKRLRYVIEPAAGFIDGGKAIIETLKSLQDSLGDLHDVHVFSEQLIGGAEQDAETRPGLLRLGRRLRERGAHAYASVERDWLNDAGASFFVRVGEFAAALRRCASAGTEIERKYLLSRLPERVHAASSVDIKQGYVPGEKVVERIRRVRSSDGTELWYRTIKVGVGLERVELEEETDSELSRAMWRLTKGRRIHKRRYAIRESDDALWEVDEFLDRALVLAEIELTDAETEVELPAWLREVVDREVTDEPEYSNARLAATSSRDP